MIVDDDDRIYFIDSSRVVRIVDDESERITSEILPTDDPDKWTIRLSIPAPRYYIKRAVIKED